MVTAATQKTIGAFYTAQPIARFLVEWAVRAPSDSVLDPSCGDGAFIDAAVARLDELGSNAPKVWGVDLHSDAIAAAHSLFPTGQLINSDFFALGPSDLPQFDAVVGNPPFIRYQIFSGHSRSSALSRTRSVGVNLSSLTSSWAPFVIHSVAFLRPGGRLAMVVPAELGHAQYAQGVLRFLTQEFSKIKVCLFRQKLFPHLSEDTFLLLAEGRGSKCRWFSVSSYENIEAALAGEDNDRPVDLEAVKSGDVRLSHYLLSPKVKSLYRYLAEQTNVQRLGDVSDVGIGYVTGANDFFHLSEDEVIHQRVARKYLRPAVGSLGSHSGLVFRRSDWQSRRREGKKSYLLALPPTREKGFAAGIRSYLSRGRASQIHLRFKCRVRDPWYSVPHVRKADAFLSYMSGGRPKFVLNPCGLVAPNTLHLVQFVEPKYAKSITTGWYSSLTSLSCEMEGHALGGGMLKLEPTEAGRVLVALPKTRNIPLLLERTDSYLREARTEEARDLVDRYVLRAVFGLSATECNMLADSARLLEAWRLHR
ncbi:MAG: N-6 DNA methylase [Candidatus Acidiferrum sp.]